MRQDQIEIGNSRQHLRKSVKDKIVVEVEDCGLFLRSKVCNLGVGGMGVWLPTGVDIGAVLTVNWGSQCFRGVVRHTREVANGTVAGIEFI
jgi:hypothetical protein